MGNARLRRAVLGLAFLASPAALAQAVPPSMPAPLQSPLPLSSIGDGAPSQPRYPQPLASGGAETAQPPSMPAVLDQVPAGGAPSYPAPLASQTPENFGSPAPVRPTAGVDGRAVGLGQVQKAWDFAIPSPGQIGAGILRFPYTPNETYTVVSRYLAQSTIVFPQCERIKRMSIGDVWGFPLMQTAPNAVAIRPAAAEIDTTMTVTMESGRVYSFYLRSDRIDSENVPDVTVFVDDDRFCERGPQVVLESDGTRLVPVYGPTPAAWPGAGEENAPADAQPDFLRKVPIDVDNFSFDDIEIQARSDADLAIAPVRAWHDGTRTFLDFGDRVDSSRMPAVFELDEGVDNLIQTIVAGAKDQILIVPSIKDLTLKSGELFVCIRNRYRPPRGFEAMIDKLAGGRV